MNVLTVDQEMKQSDAKGVKRNDKKTVFSSCDLGGSVE